MKNKLKLYQNKISLFLFTLFLLQLTLFNTTDISYAVTSPSVSYSITGNATVGNTIIIAVNISNISDLYGGSIDFLYDTNLLEVQSITKGNIFSSNETNLPLGDNGKISNGQASFAISMIGNKDGVSASGTLAIIKAKVLKTGVINLNTTSSSTSTLSLSNKTIRVKLSNSSPSKISYSFTNKSISLLTSAKLTSLTANKTTSTLGENVTFTASSNLGNNDQYSFSVYINGAWKKLQSYSSKNTFSYKATKAGSYKVKVYVRDKNNTSNKTSKTLSFTVNNKATVTLKANTTSTVLGKSVTFTTSSNLGANAQYSFYVYINDSWKKVQSYSSKNTFSYKATKAGTYKVKVYVRDKNNTSNKSSKTLSFTVTNKPTITLKANKTSTTLGKSITFTASSNLGTNAQYSFSIYINGAWKKVQSYSSKNTFSYKAPKSGSYRVRAYVRDKNNTSNKSSKDLYFTVK